jgi:23S rRNA pseudouridine2605 synthase
MERIAKYIASTGFCSRRKAEELIKQGKVKLNNKLIDTPINFVSEGDIVEVDGQKIAKIEHEKLWIINKPEGYLCTRKDDFGRKTIYDLLPQNFENIHYIGRLDINSEGLLLLTNSPKVKRFYEHPDNKIERVYLVKIYGKFNNKILTKTQKPFAIYDKEKDQKIIYKAKIDPYKLNKDSKNNWLKFTLTEGKNREIRKICSHFDLQVSKLRRIKYGEFEISGLKKGEFKEVT